MANTFARVRATLFAIGWAALVLVASAPCTTTAARAQAGANAPSTQAVLSAGPILLNDGESALIGLLLPAVQKLQRDAHLVLFNGDGKVLADVPVAMGDGSVKPASFRVTFTRGVFRIVGPDLKEMSVSGDGNLSAVLLPAVQRGALVLPVSSSVQILDRDGLRGQIVGFCDGSV